MGWPTPRSVVVLNFHWNLSSTDVVCSWVYVNMCSNFVLDKLGHSFLGNGWPTLSSRGFIVIFIQAKKLGGKVSSTLLTHLLPVSTCPLRDLFPVILANGQVSSSGPGAHQNWPKLWTIKTQVRGFVEAQDFLDSDQRDICYVSALSKDCVEVHHKMKDHEDLLSTNLNIFVACFTTCWGRLRLYEALDHLQDRALYFDTDSVIHPTLDDFLGNFTDELDKGDHIVEFCSGGPNNYGYKKARGKTVVKVHRFSFCVEDSAPLNYEVLKQYTLDELLRPLDQLSTRPLHKNYCLVYSKGILDPDTVWHLTIRISSTGGGRSQQY